MNKPIKHKAPILLYRSRMKRKRIVKSKKVMAHKRLAILYARSATGQNDAIAKQMSLCRAWAELHGYSVIGEYSEVASGMARHLPEQAKALAHAMNDSILLICTGPDRLSRDIGRLADIMVACARNGVQVYFVKG